MTYYQTVEIAIFIIFIFVRNSSKFLFVIKLTFEKQMNIRRKKWDEN